MDNWSTMETDHDYLGESLQALSLHVLSPSSLTPEHALRGKQAFLMPQTHHSRCLERAHTLQGNCCFVPQTLHYIFFIYSCVHACVHLQVPWRTCGGQRTNLSCRGLFSPSHHGSGGSSSGHQAWRQCLYPLSFPTHPATCFVCALHCSCGIYYLTNTIRMLSL